MFRILTERDRAGHVVRLAGRLADEATGELARVLDGLSGSVRVDCTDLRSADDAGLAALGALRARGIGLTGLSPYWKLRLGADRPPPRATPPGGGDPTAGDDPARGHEGGTRR